jgi:hypothetical protein
MKRRDAMTYRSPMIMAAVICVAGTSSAWAGEGWGMSKKSVTLNRSMPAQVKLAGTRIQVRVSALKKSNAGVAERMQTELESELLGNDASLTLDGKSPTTAVDVIVLRSEYSDSAETRQEARGNQKKGSNNPLKVDVEQTAVSYKTVRQTFTVSLKARDVRANKMLVADNITKNYKESIEEGNAVPDPGTVEDTNMTDVVQEITRILTPTKETITVMLPRGRLDDAVPYGLAGMWNKYLDVMLRLPVLTNPVEESYHQYALGVAYEALAYSADDLDAALKYLEKAATYYNNAAEANPKETNFILSSKPSSLFARAQSTAGKLIPVLSQHKEKKQPVLLQAPLGRVEAAQAQYQKLKDLRGGSRGSTDKPTSKASADAVTNESIVDMLRAGIPEDVIIATIDGAPQRNLDVTPKGLIQLSEAKASPDLLRHVREVASKSTASKGGGSGKKGH